MDYGGDYGDYVGDGYADGYVGDYVGVDDYAGEEYVTEGVDEGYYTQELADGIETDTVLETVTDFGYDDPYLFDSYDTIGDSYYGDDLVFDEFYDNGDLLYDRMGYLEAPIPLAEAWAVDDWGADQLAFADLMAFERALELDRSLSEAERMRFFEERLLFDELDARERMRRYQTMPVSLRTRLGLHDGYWARELGGRRDLDLSYLRSQPLSRGIFSAPFRNVFARHQALGRRYVPLVSPRRLLGLNRTNPQPGLSSLPGRRPYGGGYARGPGGVGGGPLGAAYGGPGLGGRSRFAASGVPYISRTLTREIRIVGGIRLDDLRARIRLAESRASLSSLTPEMRSRALDEARNLKAQFNSEIRRTQEIDRSQRERDANLNARLQVDEAREYQRDMEEARHEARLEVAAEREGEMILRERRDEIIVPGRYENYGGDLVRRRSSHGGYYPSHHGGYY